MPRRQSESSYIANEILPFLHSCYGYPIHDAEQVRINDVPIFNPSGGRSSSTMDIVYYCNEEPVLLVEAKRKHKSHDSALKEALVYLLNFPIKKREFARSGIPPKFLATTVGHEVKFYRWEIDYDKPIPSFMTHEIEILPFDKLIEYYGLSPGYRARVLTSKEFKIDFFDELVAIFRLGAREKITADIIKNVSLQILNFLQYDRKFVGQCPYLELSTQRQTAVWDLFKRFDLAGSLGPDTAKAFRGAVLRSFQGGGFNQYITHQSIIAFMSDLISGFTPEIKILDFECGSGGFLSAAVERGVRLENILGIDIDELPYIVAKTYLALYFKKTGVTINSLPIKNGNGLFDQGNNWDIIIGNPAGGDNYRHGNLKEIEDHLRIHLENNRISSEYSLSIQQALVSAKIGGKICLILPEGFFSNSSDEYLRKFVAKHCKIFVIVSLPRGVFKKGTSTTTQRSGSQSASMKMSILFAEKTRGIDKDNPIGDDDFSNLDYPVFIASVNAPDSLTGMIADWLDPQLEVVLNQWHEWSTKHELKKIPRIDIKTTKVDTNRSEAISTLTNDKAYKTKSLASPKSSTKISKSLEDIFSD